jgi:iron complex transport system substrate-binding protein
VPPPSKRPATPAAWAAPVLLLAGALWLGAALSTVRAGDLGLVRAGTPAIRGETFPKEILDPSGGRAVIPAAPRRVVSLNIGADEILTALVEPERVAGVSRFADSPEMSTCVDRVPAHAARIRGADPEPILALQPDLVFAAVYNLESGVRILTGAGIPVVRFGNFRSYEDVIANVRVAGAALGAEARAEALIHQMNDRLGHIADRIRDRKPPRVLYYSPVGYTSGGATLVDEKIGRAGGLNVVSAEGILGPKHLSVELLVSLGPEVIVVPRWTPEHDPAAALLADPVWRDTPAVQGGRVHALDAKWLTSVSPDGVRGVEELARVLHPEAFTS